MSDFCSLGKNIRHIPSVLKGDADTPEYKRGVVDNNFLVFLYDVSQDTDVAFRVFF